MSEDSQPIDTNNNENSDNEDFSLQSAAGPRSIDMDFYSGLNRQFIVPGSASTGKRGKGAGLYCETCNLTFKDSIQYLDHINSKEHLYSTTGGVDIDALNAQITVQDVRKRLKFLKKKKEMESKETGEVFDLKKRIENRKKWELEQAVKKKEKKKMIQKEKKERLSRKRKREQEEGEMGQKDMDMAKMMGFSGFGSTKQ